MPQLDFSIIWTVLAWAVTSAFSAGITIMTFKNDIKNLQNESKEYKNYIADLTRNDVDLDKRLIKLETTIQDHLPRIDKRLEDIVCDLKNHLSKS